MRAAEGEFGDEGRYVMAAVDAMGRALADWDAALVRTAATSRPSPRRRRRRPPPRHVALAAAYLERGRFAEALEHLDLATRLAPAFTDAYLLRGWSSSASGAPRRLRPRIALRRRRVAGISPGRTRGPVPADPARIAPPRDGGGRWLLAAVMTPAPRASCFRPIAFSTTAASAAPVLPFAR